MNPTTKAKIAKASVNATPTNIIACILPEASVFLPIASSAFDTMRPTPMPWPKTPMPTASAIPSVFAASSSIYNTLIFKRCRQMYHEKRLILNPPRLTVARFFYTVPVVQWRKEIPWEEASTRWLGIWQVPTYQPALKFLGIPMYGIARNAQRAAGTYGFQATTRARHACGILSPKRTARDSSRRHAEPDSTAGFIPAVF